MDGKGRALDNIVIERFWRTLKYGDIYLKDYENPLEAVKGIGRYIDKYNRRRPHKAVGRRTPDEAYNTNMVIYESDRENQRKIS